MSEVVCCIDVGTTRTKVALIDSQGSFVSQSAAPTPGADAGDADRALDPDALETTVCGLIRGLVAESGDHPRVAGVARVAVEAICVTNQRATLLALDDAGRALTVLSWQDMRSEEVLADLASELDSNSYQSLTGLPHSAFWPLTKIRWLQRRRPDVAADACRYGLVHDDLLMRLGADEPVIDPSNASLTGFWEPERGRWSESLLALVGLTQSHLPRVVNAGSPAGTLGREAAAATGLSTSIPLFVGGGDQACAALGLGVLSPGQVGLSLGTAADILAPMAGVPEPRPGRIVTDHILPGMCLLEGFFGAFGASLAWCRALLGSDGDTHQAAAQFDTSAEAPLYLPFLSGVATPDFNPAMRGALLGLTADHGPEAIESAVMDGLAMELRRILESRVATGDVTEMVVSGGGVRAPGMLRRLADATQVTLVAHPESEAALLGTAAVAWYGRGVFDGLKTAARAVAGSPGRRQEPVLSSERVANRYARYCHWVETMLAATEAP